MPLHKIPLCNLKYVGDIDTSATFIYKNIIDIRKQANNTMLEVQDKTEINKDDKNIKYLKNNMYRTINKKEIQLLDFLKSKVLNKDINNNGNVKLLKRFELWVYVKNNKHSLQNDNDNNKIYKNDKYILKESDLKNVNIINMNKLLFKFDNNIILCNNKLFNTDNKNINIDFYSYLYDVPVKNIAYKDTCQYLGYLKDINYYKNSIHFYNNEEIDLNFIKNNIYYINKNNKNIYSKNNNKLYFKEENKNILYVPNNQYYISKNENNIKKYNSYLLDNNRSKKIIINNKLNFLSKYEKDINLISNEERFIDKTLTNITVINNYNKSLNKYKKNINKASVNKEIISRYRNIFINNNDNDNYFINSNIKNIDNINKFKILKENHYRNIFINNNEYFVNHLYKKEIFKNKYLFLNKNTLKLINNINNNTLIDSKNINKKCIFKENENKAIETHNNKDLNKNIFNTFVTISFKEISNVKTYVQLNTFLKECQILNSVLIGKTNKKNILKNKIKLVNINRKHIQLNKQIRQLNKRYKVINIYNNYNKLIGKCKKNINSEIYDKNLRRIKPYNISKQSNKLLKHTYINQISNNCYDKLLQRIILTKEIFKQENLLLDKMNLSYNITKQNNCLLEYVYYLNMNVEQNKTMEKLKNNNIQRHQNIQLEKQFIEINNIKYDKSLNKEKKYINKKDYYLLKITERWWVLNPTSPYDKKILPFDYDYSRVPLVSKNNITHTLTNINKHPLSFAPYMIDSNNDGKDLNWGIKEIDISIEIMIDMVNIVGMIILQEVNKFKHCTGQEALEFIIELLFDWLTMDSTIRKMEQNNSREHYLRCYRWIRWEAEQLWFEADKDHTIFKSLGIKFAGKLLAKLIDYMKYHHFDIVPFWNNLRFMDIERQFYKAKNGDIFKSVSKNKSYRHYEIDTKIQTKQHLFQK